MSRTHELKTWPEPFAAVLAGTKRHEIRVDDRGFAVGDVLVLREWEPEPEKDAYGFRYAEKPWRKLYEYDGYTGRVLTVRVTYLTPGGAWGLPAGLCVMSIELKEQGNGDE